VQNKRDTPFPHRKNGGFTKGFEADFPEQLPGLMDIL